MIIFSLILRKITFKLNLQSMLGTSSLAVEASSIFMQFQSMRCIVMKYEGVKGLIGVVEEIDVKWLYLVAADKKFEDVNFCILLSFTLNLCFRRQHFIYGFCLVILGRVIILFRALDRLLSSGGMWVRQGNRWLKWCRLLFIMVLRSSSQEWVEVLLELLWYFQGIWRWCHHRGCDSCQEIAEFR